jgi:tRNA pseudouridine32 synthase/23S rRNA pseudouridine746 synthase
MSDVLRETTVEALRDLGFPDLEFAVVHVDERLIVLDKPTGLLAVPGRGPELQDCLSARVQTAWPQARVVHRLDRDTSGLMLMALDVEAQRHLSQQFAERRVTKRYTAVVGGCPAGDEGVVNLPMRKDLEHPPRHCVDLELGRPAETRWRVVERRADRSRLEVCPVTGRSHQIRLHLSTIGHPVLGDNLYADPTVRSMAPRLMLHAEWLSLSHPDDERAMDWHSPCPF